MALGTKRRASNTLSKQPLDLPPATVHAFAGTSSPEGWAMCDGSEVSRSDNAALFAAIGTTYGVGDGSTTFNLPDMRGEFLRGLDNMGTAEGARGKDVDGTARTVGETQEDAMQGHKHTLDGYQPDNRYAGSGGGMLYAGGSTSISSPVSDGTNGTPRTSSESRPVNMAINYIIKL